MKKFFINLVLESVFDALLMQLKVLAGRSDNELDDDAVRIIQKHKGIIIQGIRSKL